MLIFILFNALYTTEQYSCTTLWNCNCSWWKWCALDWFRKWRIEIRDLGHFVRVQVQIDANLTSCLSINSLIVYRRVSSFKKFCDFCISSQCKLQSKRILKIVLQEKKYAKKSWKLAAIQTVNQEQLLTTVFLMCHLPHHKSQQCCHQNECCHLKYHTRSPFPVIFVFAFKVRFVVRIIFTFIESNSFANSSRQWSVSCCNNS